MDALGRWARQDENRWYSIEGNGSTKACVKLFWDDMRCTTTVMAPTLAEAICQAIIAASRDAEE